MKVNTRNTSSKLIAEERRMAVAAMRKRRLSLREIEASLANAGHRNPATGKPWSLAVIAKDVKLLQERWRDEALRDVSEHKSEILAEYDELLKIAWREKDYEQVRKLLKDVRELLGTDAPQVIVFEQVQQVMTDAVEALEREFSDDPALLTRALDALMGADNQRATLLN